MPCPTTPDSDDRHRFHRWENYIQSVDMVVESYWTPKSLGELAYIVQRAESEGRRVHAVGAGYSFEDIAATPDWMVDLSALSRILPVDTASGLVDSGTGSRALTAQWRERHFGSGPDKLLHVESGVRLFDLNEELTRRGLALPTMGGAQGQHLAGAISTSTHGSDVDEPPMCDLVQAVHLVTTGGKEMWIEAASTPLTDDDAELRAVLTGPLSACGDIEIARDDELFNAVLVGMGRFGIIYSMVLRVTNAFRLAAYAKELPWRDVADALVAGAGDSDPFAPLATFLADEDPPPELGISGDHADHRYLDIIFNPRKGDTCWVRRRWITENATDLNLSGSNFLCCTGVANGLLLAAAAGLRIYAGAVAALPFYGWVKSIEINVRATELETMALDPHVTAGAALSAALNAVWASQIENELGDLIDEITQMAISGEIGESATEGRRGTNWAISAGTQDPVSLGDCYRGNSIEIVFSLDSRAYIDFIDAVLANAGNYLHAGYMAVRFSRKSRALLSMHNVNHDLACSIEVTSLRGVADNEDWMRWLEHTGLALGGRPHWGQQNQLRASDVQRLYGGDLRKWRSQLERIVGNDRTFSNHYTQQRGLEPMRSSLWHAAWLHGNKVKVEAPEKIVREWRAGFYCRLEGEPGSENWLHFAIPTPVIVDGKRLSVGPVMLRYRATHGAVVHAVHVYDGERKIANYNRMIRHPSDWAFEGFAVDGNPEVRWGLGISIGVRFPEAGARLELASVGCDFLLRR